MLELPEAYTVAHQINSQLIGREIVAATAAQSPHKFAWYFEDPETYGQRLSGRRIEKAVSLGGFIRIAAGSVMLLFGDGANLRYHPAGEKRPKKHQLLVEFDDRSALSVTIQMYGGIWCCPRDAFNNPYYQVALEKPSPLSDDFSEGYFADLLQDPQVQRLSLKAALATEQRIPGLGNGTLQDILWNAALHPKRKVNTISALEQHRLYKAVKSTLREMADRGGRDTEKDLFGHPGGYAVQMCRNTLGKNCPRCGSSIEKAAYLGGAIYYCPGCQVN